jgi:hypothetical protein
VRVDRLEHGGIERRLHERLQVGVVDRGRGGRGGPPVDREGEAHPDRVLAHVLVDGGVREAGEAVAHAGHQDVGLDLGPDRLR